MTVPTIDVAPLAGADQARRAETVALLTQACQTVGFFAVVGHGIPRDRVEAALGGARRFFALPETAKLAFRGDDMANTNRGYIPLGGERLSADLPPDIKEAFNIGPEHAPDIPGMPAVHPCMSANLWPDLPGWREVMLDYLACCHALGLLLHGAFAEILGVEVGYFEPALRAPGSVLRLLHYPGTAGDEGQAGAGEHTDYGNLTLLVTDGVAGLQIRNRSGDWIDLAGVPDGFICNIGDCLMRWSNGLFASTPHRVISPPMERYSMAYFLDANPDALVTPILTPAAPEPTFPPITSGAFIQARLSPTYAHTQES